MNMEDFLATAQAAALDRMRRDDELVAAALQAAHGGDVAAAYAVATRLHFGDGMEPSLDGARNWYARAAAAGDSRAMHQLGALAADREDFPEAVRWFEQAAEAGDASALCHLGRLYASGQGVETDPERGRELLTRSAAAGFLKAKVQLALLLRPGPEGSPEFVALVENAAAGQDPDGLYHFARCLADGRGVPADAPRAAHLMRRAAALGQSDAATWLRDRDERRRLPWVWTPGQSLGPLHFGAPVRNFVADLGLIPELFMGEEDPSPEGFWDSEFFGVAVQVTANAEDVLSVTFDAESVPRPMFRDERVLDRDLAATLALLEVDDWTLDADCVDDDAWFDSESLALTLHIRDGWVHGASFDLNRDDARWHDA